MKKIFLAVLVVAAFLLTSAQVKKNGIQSTPPQVVGNAELFICDEMAKTAESPIDKSRFKNFATFTSNGVFTVPAGVTEVLVEMWGAGGGAHVPGGGGGSGGYWTGLLPVTGITSINITIGTGGASGSGTTAAGSGGNTGFTCTGFNVSTGGGAGADSTATSAIESYIGGKGGDALVNNTVPAGFNAFYAAPGQHGTPTRVEFVQANATVFTRIMIAGTGGIAPFSGQQPYPVTSLVVLTSGIKGISSSVNYGASTPHFGAGGNLAAMSNAFAGGKGRLVVYF